MFKNRGQLVALAIVIVVVAAAAYWLFRGSGSASTIDLVAALGDATKSSHWDQPGDAAFTVKDVDLAGVTHQAIFAPPPSRITWRVEVPRRGTLDVAFGLGPEAWMADGDGALFMVAVSDGRTYEEYLREAVNPRERERDRRWLTATIDLSAYEGQTVDVIFNTRAGPNDSADARNDIAYWGRPTITGR